MQSIIDFIMLTCHICKRTFASNNTSALTRHYTLCRHKSHSTFSHDTENTINAPTILPPSEVILHSTSVNSTNTAVTNNLLDIQDVSIQTEMVDDNSIALELTTEQRALLVQEKHFAKSVHGTKFHWSNMELANIELLHILDKHN